MPSLIDRAGQIFGYLTVLKRAPNKGIVTQWLCRCICEKEVIVTQTNLRTGATKSCGCLSNYMRSSNNAYATHRKSKSPEYKCWIMMKTRCSNHRYSHYAYYGGRGIFVCPEWDNSFETFLKDMGPRPEGYTIERKDSNDGYHPANCRWATREEQVDNRRNAVTYLHLGQQMSLKQIAKLYDTSRQALYAFIYRGNTLEVAIERCRRID